MSTQQTELAEAVGRVLDDLGRMPNMSFEQAWDHVVEIGVPLLMLPEHAGGFGGSWSDLLAVQREVGRVGAALPTGEMVLANGMMAAAGLDTPTQFGSLAIDGHGIQHQGKFSGLFHNVPWGRHARWIVGILPERTCVRLETAHAKLTNASNLAGEPRDTLEFSEVPCDTLGRVGELFPGRASSGSHQWAAHKVGAPECGALIRLGQMAGALAAALTMTTEYVKTRVQFNKTLGTFQAVQQQLAVFAMEVSAAGCAARVACEKVDRHGLSLDTAYAIAAAKLRANMAVEVATAIAHQMHGALGFTAEYGLHRLTRRLWAWRTEAGHDRYWAARLGAHVIQRGSDEVWSDIVRA